MTPYAQDTDDPRRDPYERSASRSAGFTLIEILIASGIIAMLGVGLWSAWILGIQVVAERRAQVTATSLATEKLERIRSLDYDAVGTVGGIPAGATPQTEIITRNTVVYTVRTTAVYIDDPFDDVAPRDLVPNDRKNIRIDVGWVGRFGTTPVTLTTDVAPRGIESTVGGGTIMIRVFDANVAPVEGATVTIVNTRVNPTITLALTTDATGIVLLPGAPASQDGYDITVTKSGYSTAQTYRAEIGVNPSPAPPPLTVAERELTQATFGIDRLGTLTLRTVGADPNTNWWRSTWRYRRSITIRNTRSSPIAAGTPTRIDLRHNDIVTQGKSLATGDDVRLVFFDGSAANEIDRMNDSPWNVSNATELWFALQRSVPAQSTDDGYALYYGNLGAGLPPTNAAPDPSANVQSTMEAETASVPRPPVPNVAVTVTGAKRIGTDDTGAPIPKYKQTVTTDSAGTRILDGLEWDTYAITVAGSSGYDIAGTLPLTPITVSPNGAVSEQLTVLPHQTHTLLVTVTDGTNVVDGAVAQLTRAESGYTASLATNEGGQAFFAPPVGDVTYDLVVTKNGFVTSITTAFVNGQSATTVALARP